MCWEARWCTDSKERKAKFAFLQDRRDPLTVAVRVAVANLGVPFEKLVTSTPGGNHIFPVGTLDPGSGSGATRLRSATGNCLTGLGQGYLVRLHGVDGGVWREQDADLCQRPKNLTNVPLSTPPMLGLATAFPTDEPIVSIRARLRNAMRQSGSRRRRSGAGIRKVRDLQSEDSDVHSQAKPQSIWHPIASPTIDIDKFENNCLGPNVCFARLSKMLPGRF